MLDEKRFWPSTVRFPKEVMNEIKRFGIGTLEYLFGFKIEI